MNRLCLICILTLGLSQMAFATGDANGKPAAAAAITNLATARQSTTQGSVTVEGKRIGYTAEAGTLIIKNAKNQPAASMSYVAYFANGVKDPASRPITFFYNGGPGSATIWLHMGAFGPRRAVVGDHEHTAPAAYKLVNNDYSLLDATDMVFIDAVGTGFGRVLDKNNGGQGTPKDFYGVDQDALAFSQFITQFLSKYQRWNSPKYLFGESYGTPRSAVLANDLEINNEFELNGVILLSSILNFDINADNPNSNPGIDLPYALMLPTFAATAWYYHKLPTQPAELVPFLHEAETFAMKDYLPALQAGSTLPPAAEQQMAEKLHAYTGLSVDYLLKADLRVTGPEFEQQLLLDSQQVTGRFDTRYSGPVFDPLAEVPYYDPQSVSIGSAIVSLFNDYVRRDLKLDEGMTYIPDSNDIGNAWDLKHQPPGASAPLQQTTNVMPDLAAAMVQNPDLKVMLNGGYFDLATPYYAAIYVMHHLPMPASLQKNIQYDFYPAGHMVYVNIECLKMLHDNVAKFIESSHDSGEATSE